MVKVFNVVKTVSDDVIHRIVRDLRPTDVEEIKDLGGYTDPLEAIELSLQCSEVIFTVTPKDSVEGLGGICPDGMIWMVGTQHLDVLSARKKLLAAGKRFIGYYRNKYKLYNYCTSKDTHVRCMEAVGFTATDCGYEGATLIRCV